MSGNTKRQPKAASKPLWKQLIMPTLIVVAILSGLWMYQQVEAVEPVAPVDVEPAVELTEEESGFFRSMIDNAIARADGELDEKRATLEAFEDGLDEREAILAERESESAVRYGSIVTASTSLQECALNALKEVSDAQDPS